MRHSEDSNRSHKTREEDTEGDEEVPNTLTTHRQSKAE
jgi:hypothetical protein